MGFYPHDLSLYRVALMHRSTTSTNRQMRHINNERLEFLGDAILGAVVADIVYERYKDQQEGFLTTLRSKIVKRETLNDLAVKIGLDKLVIHSDRIASSHNNYMNGNAFEAFIGAIYLDRGYDFCMSFIKERILQYYINIDKMSQKEENYKSKIIEWCQRYQCQFDFVITNEKMEAGNAPKFYAEVVIEGLTCGKGTGYSKKESHQNASHQAFKKVQSDVNFVNSIMDRRNQRINGKIEPQQPKPQQPKPQPIEKKEIRQEVKQQLPVEKKEVRQEVKQQLPAEKKEVRQEVKQQQPVEKKPIENKPTEKQTVERKTAEKKPAEKKTTEKKPAEKKPTEKVPAEKRTKEKKPVEKKEVTNQQSAEPQPAEQEVAKRPATRRRRTTKPKEEE
ncbi:MAG: ribonuclease III [Bacteroidaceae bacterium]|nr:ribonuclease III [Bacteroidaceae bacterium]